MKHTINHNNSINIVRSPIKWVGGKRQIIEELLNEYPSNIHDYYELFLGSGTVLLNVLENIPVKGKVYAYDINPVIITMFRCITCDPKKLLNHLKRMHKKYLDNPSGYFHKQKDIYNKLKSESNIHCINKKSYLLSSLFIFLNKTCFRGLYRENADGYFNVSFGHYANPLIYDPETILYASALINKHNVIFQCKSFLDVSISKQRNKDVFVYMDPPYYGGIEMFQQYYGDGFISLYPKFVEYTRALKCSFLMSNSNHPQIYKWFKGYKIKKITVRRAINANNPDDTAVEVFITNQQKTN